MSLAGWGERARPLGTVQQPQQGINLRFGDRRRSFRHPPPRPLHRLLHAGAVEGLQQVIHGIHVEGAHRVLVVRGCEHDLRQVFFIGARPQARLGFAAVLQLLDDRKSIQAGHLHVEKNKVGVVFLDQVYGFNAVGSLGHDLDAADRVEQVLQLVAGQLFVVDNERGKRHAEA